MKKLIVIFVGLFISGNVSAADWYSSYNKDEMRGTAQKFVQTDSDNAVDFDFPYNGGSNLMLILRSKKTELEAGQKAEDLALSEAIIAISKGQFLCHSYSGCHVYVKFDDGKIQKYAMSETSGGRTDVIFFNNSTKFIKELRKHKKLILEAEFYQDGAKQFKFDLTGVNSPKS
ncbi:hypothetical protein C3432_00200 [Citrobacter amalonaticus]|uniref:Uncharacterized protein n=1 Tax=Citrobacter amalonaticus TaxID=35703 RepID=A0A2S4S1P9_CITAM|nr:hypothetical protein [Citrobacter amalonaticus]POT59198.1 hypothetical protein C3432_00200 [Citrobacter amalonaticus]POT77328.1 hypothetical protein C3436_07870 [Citrobacter amalonaticus]POU67780.1 hypothetical protein C3430_01405 [Citrobacter amalonaticus]POV07384.1 hypothetical protein C3424_01415 [Citrobacter amalonaticus]